MASSIDQQFIEYIIKSIVNKPDAVKIDRRVDEKGVLLELTVDQEDLGRVIGKRGATAQSLRTLLRALGTKNDARYNLKIVDIGPPPAKRDDSGSQSNDNASSDDAPTDSDPAVKPTDDDSTAADDQTVSDEIEEPREDENTASENSAGGETDHSSVIDKTRAELAELDDLDV